MCNCTWPAAHNVQLVWVELSRAHLDVDSMLILLHIARLQVGLHEREDLDGVQIRPTVACAFFAILRLHLGSPATIEVSNLLCEYIFNSP